jgi:hypothetical protein
MTASVLAVVIAANQQTKSPNGALGLLVFLVLAVGVVFLLRSMTRHLRKVERMSFDDPPPSSTDDLPPKAKPGQVPNSRDPRA